MSERDIRKPHLRQFYRNQQGKDYITYPGLLAEFHAQNDAWMANHPDAPDQRRIAANIVQLPTAANDNVAICTSEVRMASGTTYCELADAAPGNVNSMLKNALLRMAATRAKGRALRDATNIGTTMYEELPDAEATEHDEGEAAGSPSHGGMVAQDGDFTPSDEGKATEQQWNRMWAIHKALEEAGVDHPRVPAKGPFLSQWTYEKGQQYLQRLIDAEKAAGLK